MSWLGSMLSSVGHGLSDAGKAVVHGAEDGAKGVASGAKDGAKAVASGVEDGWKSAFNDAKAAVGLLGTGVRSLDAAKEQLGSWIDSGEKRLESKVDEGRAWLRQHGGVAGQMASDWIGFGEGVDISLYDAGKGLVQLADTAGSLANPIEWAANPSANIARVKSTVNTVESLGKIAGLADPASWTTNPQGNAQLAGALWHSAATSFESDPAKFIGNAVGTVGTLFIPGADAAGAAGDAARVTELATDASKAATITQDAGKAATITGDASNAATITGDASKAAATPIDPQLDANFLVKLGNGEPAFTAYATANKAAGLSYNVAARGEFLANGLGTRAELRLLQEQYGVNLIRDVPGPVIDRVAPQLRAAFTDGRVLGVKDSRIAASAFVKGERLATNDLQFFKRAKDLGINVDYVGTGNAAAKAANYVPRLVDVSGIVVP